MKSKEILMKHIPKDCIWEGMDNLTNCPMKYIINAMEEYAEQFKIKIIPSDCTCCGDQYGMATNPECIIHGDKR